MPPRGLGRGLAAGRIPYGEPHSVEPLRAAAWHAVPAFQPLALVDMQQGLLLEFTRCVEHRRTVARIFKALVGQQRI